MSRLAEQGKQRMGQYGQQEQRVSPVIAFDDGLCESQSKARVLHVPERLLHCEAPSIGDLDLNAFEVVPTADQTPGLLHGLVLDTDDDGHKMSLRGDPRVPEHAHAPGRSQPCLGLSPLTSGILHIHIPSEADNVVKP